MKYKLDLSFNIVVGTENYMSIDRNPCFLEVQPDVLAWIKGVTCMRKILIVAMNYAPEFAGCGQYTGDLGKALAERGHRIEVITSAPHYPGWRVQQPYSNSYMKEKLDGAIVYRCPILLRQAMQGLWRFLAPLSFAVTSGPLVLWRILKFVPDTVLVVEPTLLVAPLSILAAKFIGARTALHVQDLEVDCAFSVGHLVSHSWLMNLAYIFERACLTQFDKLITISAKMRNMLVKKGVKQERISIVRNWVDLNHIRPLEISYDYRHKLGLPRDAFIVLYSGNIGPKQGLNIVIEAARILCHVSNILFVIAGDGPTKTELQDLSCELKNIRFLPFQPYDQLAEFLGLCNLHILPQLAAAGDLVLPSKLGGMLASGRPIVVTTEPHTELAECLDGVATIVPPENPTALAQAIHRIATSVVSYNSSLGFALALELSRPSAINRLEYVLAG